MMERHIKIQGLQKTTVCIYMPLLLLKCVYELEGYAHPFLVVFVYLHLLIEYLFWFAASVRLYLGLSGRKYGFSPHALTVLLCRV